MADDTNLPFDDTDKHELGDVIRANIEFYLRHMFNTGIPAQITGIDDYESKQVINVTPIINNTYKDGVVLEYPELLDVPVILPSAGRGLLSFPVRINDVVWLSFSQRNLGEFKDGVGDEPAGLPFQRFTPGTRSLNELKDAVAFLGGDTETSHLQPNPNDVELKFADSHIRLQPDGTIFIKTDKDLKVEVTENLTADVGGNATIDVVGDTVLTGGGKLDLDITGKVLIKSGSEIELEAPLITLTGPVEASETITATGDVKGADVTATTLDVTLSSHTDTALASPPTPGT